MEDDLGEENVEYEDEHVEALAEPHMELHVEMKAILESHWIYLLLMRTICQGNYGMVW